MFYVLCCKLRTMKDDFSKQHENYLRIAKAIAYIQNHFKEQPNLNTLAAHLNLSPAHFHRLFTEWAGTSPKKFLQYTTLDYSKFLLRESESPNLFNTTFDSGLSSTSRLHDLFIKLEGMSPAEYKNGGATLNISHSFHQTIFGMTHIASTDKGICKLSFIDDKVIALQELVGEYPHAMFHAKIEDLHLQALKFLQTNDAIDLPFLKLHLKGSEFQLKVWEALLHIPTGNLTSYKTIANAVDNPNGSRAVGSAIGKNPVAILIPCHRVLQTSGQLGGYRWGLERKSALIGWEALARNKEE